MTVAQHTEPVSAKTEALSHPLDRAAGAGKPLRNRRITVLRKRALCR